MKVRHSQSQFAIQDRCEKKSKISCRLKLAFLFCFVFNFIERVSRFVMLIWKLKFFNMLIWKCTDIYKHSCGED